MVHYVIETVYCQGNNFEHPVIFFVFYQTNIKNKQTGPQTDKSCFRRITKWYQALHYLPNNDAENVPHFTYRLHHPEVWQVHV